ncbi:MAG: response regulator [Candidatus Schekmanbacteria bacterium]|nr:response regulator [Candidatus Schekmanbacteria bacterium]
MPDNTILIVDDEESIRSLLVEFLSGEGYKTLQACDGEEAIRMVEQHRPDLVILDYMMPRVNGLEALRHIRLRFRDTYVIMLTGRGSQSTAVEVLRTGAADYITKPFKMAELLDSVAYVLQIRDRELENNRLRDRVKDHVRKAREKRGLEQPDDRRRDEAEAKVSRVVELERRNQELSHALEELLSAEQAVSRQDAVIDGLAGTISNRFLPAINDIVDALEELGTVLGARAVEPRAMQIVATAEQRCRGLAADLLDLLKSSAADLESARLLQDFRKRARDLIA